jgi:uncharacterized protein (DUF697 family)
MDNYERKISIELVSWKKEMKKQSGLVNRVSKTFQKKINGLVPEKVHGIMTESIKKVAQAALMGSEYTTKTKEVDGLSLEEKEKLVLEKIAAYKKTAAVEGAGTGAGGILLGLADFPLLLSIKMKMLFEIASLYGFDIKRYEERLYILYLFQLAFSGDHHRREVMEVIETWERYKNQFTDVDWRKFQQEYRDYIDLAKLLQLVPVIGAAVGAYANYNLVEHLGDIAMNGYRLRLLKQANEFLLE